MSITFDEIQKTVMDNQLTTKVLPVKDIQYLSEGNLLIVKNVPLKSNPKLTANLLKALGVNIQMIKNLDKIAPEMTKHYIAKARSSKTINEINAIFDKNNQIVGFDQDKSSVMPGPVFMDILSRLMNSSPDIEISGITANTQNTTIHLLDNRSEVDLFKSAGGEKSKEIFKFGTALSTGLDAPLSFEQFASRLWCTNGCSTQIENKTFNVGTITPESIWNFMSKFETFQKTGYGRAFFEGHMQTAVQTKASIKEVLDVYGMIEGKLGDAIAAEMLPIGHLYRDYARAGVDITKLNSKQKATAATNYSVWEVFNALTDAASNFGPADTRMQMTAGGILTKASDMTNVVGANPYTKNFVPVTKNIEL